MSLKKRASRVFKDFLKQKGSKSPHRDGTLEQAGEKLGRMSFSQAVDFEKGGRTMVHSQSCKRVSQVVVQ